MMSSKEYKLDGKIDCLIEAQIIDLMEATDEEINSEIEQIYGTNEKALGVFDEMLEEAISKTGSLRLANAKKEVQRFKEASSKIVDWPIANKQALLMSVREKHQDLTLAARFGEDETENDINVELEDLIELGVIDEQGNLL